MLTWQRAVLYGGKQGEGNVPIGWPEYRAKVCSSVIVERYFIVSKYCAQFENAVREKRIDVSGRVSVEREGHTTRT